MSRKVISVLLTLMILTALLSGCGKHSLADANSLTSAESAADAQATSFVHGASSLSYICVAEEGVFYIDGTGSGHFLCYYDYDADAHFVLCNAPECSHMNEECPAFFPNTISITGFAYYDGALYLLQKGPEDTVYQLIQMSVNCENKTVLADVAAGEDWSADSITDVYYCGGYAWIHAAFMRYDDAAEDWVTGQKLLAIRLSDGELISLTDMYTPSDYVAFEAISESMVAWRISSYDTPMLSSDAFYAQYGAESDYEEYLAQYYETTERIDNWWFLSIEDMEPAQMPFPGDLISAIYQDQCVGSIWEGNGETKILYDPKTGEAKELFSIQNGGSLARYQGEISNTLYEGEQLLFMEEQGDGSAQVSIYSLADGSTTPLFQDDRSITFRIIGETKDRLIGTIGTNPDRVWIWKEDYLAGDWSDAIRIISGA